MTYRTKTQTQENQGGQTKKKQYRNKEGEANGISVQPFIEGRIDEGAQELEELFAQTERRTEERGSARASLESKEVLGKSWQDL